MTAPGSHAEAAHRSADQDAMLLGFKLIQATVFTLAASASGLRAATRRAGKRLELRAASAGGRVLPGSRRSRRRGARLHLDAALI